MDHHRRAAGRITARIWQNEAKIMNLSMALPPTERLWSGVQEAAGHSLWDGRRPY